MDRKKVPRELVNYLEDTDQKPETMTDSELLEEAKWVYYLLTEVDEWGERARPANGNSVKAVKRFIDRMEKAQ